MSFFEDAYQGTPPWDIGRPQRIFVQLVERGRLKENPVLDVGCGTGENALFLAAKAFEVTGIDVSPTAIQKAKRKAKERKLRATFLAHDALRLSTLGRTFATVIDSGMFHTLDDAERPIFAEELAKALRPGGTYFLACFSEQEPNWGGPRRVTEREIRSAFPPPFRVASIEEATFDSNLQPEGHRAYLATVVRA